MKLTTPARIPPLLARQAPLRRKEHWAVMTAAETSDQQPPDLDGLQISQLRTDSMASSSVLKPWAATPQKRYRLVDATLIDPKVSIANGGQTNIPVLHLIHIELC